MSPVASVVIKGHSTLSVEGAVGVGFGQDKLGALSTT